jgi:hypothetical protein
MLKRKTQLHVSARGHLQVGSFWIFREKKCFWQRSVNLQWWGDRDLVLQRVGFFFGVYWVYRNFGVRPLAWCLRAQLCGRCSKAGPCVFGVHLVICGVFVRRTSWMWCSVVLHCWCSVVLHCWCGFTYVQIKHWNSSSIAKLCLEPQIFKLIYLPLWAGLKITSPKSCNNYYYRLRHLKHYKVSNGAICDKVCRIFHIIFLLLKYTKVITEQASTWF